MGQSNPDSMSILLSNLRIHGPQLEDYSKSTLDQGKSYKNITITVETIELTNFIFF